MLMILKTRSPVVKPDGVYSIIPRMRGLLCLHVPIRRQEKLPITGWPRGGRRPFISLLRLPWDTYISIDISYHSGS